MWHTKTIDEKHAEKKIRGYVQLAVVLLLLLDVMVPSPSWHGRSLAGLVLPIHEWIPRGVPSLMAVSLVLAACYCLFRSPAVKHSTLICQKCNGVVLNDGRTQCHCGGPLSDEAEMKWEDDAVPPPGPQAPREQDKLHSAPP